MSTGSLCSFDSIGAVIPTGFSRSILETSNILQIKATGPTTFPNRDALTVLLGKIPLRDHLTVALSVGGNDSDAITSLHADQVESVLRKWERQIDNSESDELLTIDLKIAKKRDNDSISIYSIDAYAAFFSSLTLENQLNEFRELSQGRQTHCVISHGVPSCSSSLFAFSESREQCIWHTTNRGDLSEKMADVCQNTQATIHRFIPEDFAIAESSLPPFQPLFRQLRNFLSFTFLVDRSQLEGDLLTYQVRGYKTLKGQIKSEFWNDADSTYSLYQWVYSSGGVADKIGLLRNLFSLNVTDESHPHPPDWLLAGVRSSYEIYLKKNVAQYLDVKAKVESSMAELTTKIVQQSESLLSGFKGNLAGFFAMFVSVVIATATKSGDLTHIFTPQIALLANASVGLSTLYLLLSIVFLGIGVSRVRFAYKRLKGRYTDILVLEDIQRIADNDKEYRLALLQVRIGFYSVVSIWIIMLISILLIIFVGGLYETGLDLNPFKYIQLKDALHWR